MTITVEHLTKRFGARLAVDDVSFTVRAGAVTGFLGRNGAGKTTTMRVILGLDTPTSGRALVNARRYAELDRPLTEIGALLDSGAAYPGRTARAHLTWLAAAGGIAASRVGEVLAESGLAESADQRVRTFSLGMRQRLGLAAALLGDPPVLVLDEPLNGLDAQGVRWLRTLLRARAGSGATVLIASHLLGELADVVDQLIVLDAGRLVADASLPRLMADHPSAASIEQLYLSLVTEVRP